MAHSCKNINFLDFLELPSSASEPPFRLMWKYLNVSSSVLWSLLVSRSFLENIKSVQNINILGPFPILPPPQGGQSGNGEGPARLLRGWGSLDAGAAWLMSAGSGWQGGRGLVAGVGGAHAGCRLRSPVPTVSPSGHMPLPQKPLCLHPCRLLPPAVLSSPCMGPGTFWVPSAPSQASPGSDSRF